MSMKPETLQEVSVKSILDDLSEGFDAEFEDIFGTVMADYKASTESILKSGAHTNPSKKALDRDSINFNLHDLP